MRVNAPRNLRSTTKYFSLFLIAFCLFGIATANTQAATITVTGNGDAVAVDGQCTLREAITAANTNAAVNECPAGDAGADVINFDPSAFATPKTITLTHDHLVISSELTINGTGAGNLTISGNNASRVFLISGKVTLDGLTITHGNTVGSFGNHGGGIEQFSGTLTITNSVVTGNSAELSGGGIHSQLSVLTIINSTVSGNSASSIGGGGGGGVLVADAMVTVTGSSISGNSADAGGGIYNVGSTVTIQRSTISGNSSGNGGGIYVLTGTTNLSNTTVSGNSGNSGLGGGMYYEGGTSTVTNSTIVGNGSTYAGSVYNVGGNVHLDSTIVGNGDSPAGCPGMVGEITANYSLIQDAVCGSLSGGNNLIGVLPMVGPLQYNGGPTKTHALLFNSPAINAGGPTNLTTDQRGTGFDRVIGPAADIGAFEIQPICAGVSFGTNNIGVGDAPESVTMGDFNGDGKTDLAVANAVSDNISVLIGNGDGTFAAAVNFAVANPLSVTIGDFNGDGKTDLAAVDALSDNISVLIGNGDGTFAAAVYFAVGTGNQIPYTVTTGDFNGDGKTDLATANGQLDNIAVLIGNGDGTFAAVVYFAVGDSPRSVTTGDFNGDGKTDLAAANAFSDNISVLIGNGDGTFVAAVNFPAGDAARSVTTGDFNGDGKTDLAAANELSDNISVLIGNGDGTFAAAVNFPAGDAARSVTTGDFNGDGKTDLAAANGFSDNISVLIGNGDGTFAAAVNFPVGDFPAWVATGDFNSDGKTDLAAANGGSDNVSVLLNSCSANSAPVANGDPYSTDEDTPLSGSSVLANDTDGENDTLTAVLVSGPSNAQSFTLNPDGSFSYTPNTNFNGSDSFTYKANDGSLDSNIATVTITVNAVNDGPEVSATPATQSVQYSDPISAVAINATDIDSTRLMASTTFNVGGGAFSDGLPSGLSFGLAVCSGKVGSQCRWGLSGKANVAAGTYVIRVLVSDGELSSSTDVTIVVNKEKTETVYTGDVFMFTAGPTVITANVRLSAQLTQQADGNPGDITLAKVSFLLFKSSNLGSTPDVTVAGVAVDQSGAALKFVNLGVDTWTVKVKIDADNGYWKASPVGMGTVTVEQPTNELRTSGGGWVNDAESMNGKGNFGFNVANQKKGVRGGSIYLFRGLDGFNYLVKNTSWQSGGIGFGSEGAIISKAAFSGKCVVQKIDPETGEVVDSYGNYSFTVDVRDGDLFNPRQADKYALTVLNSNGLVWRQIGSRANPPAIGGGNITVKAK